MITGQLYNEILCVIHCVIAMYCHQTLFLKKVLRTILFYGATDTPVMDFW